MNHCECLNWVSDGSRGGVAAIILAGHHPNCRHYNPMPAVLRLLTELIDGIDRWAGEENGIHDGVWEAYCRARLLIGRPVTDAEREDAP